MSARAKLALYAVALVVVLGGGLAAGAAVGPLDDEGDGAPGGRYRLAVEATSVPAGRVAPYRFRVEDGEGEVVTRFDVSHEKRLHLIVVDHGLTRYAHLHPEMAADGTWSIDLPALAPGTYRVYADVVPTGAGDMTLTTDLTVDGEPVREPLLAPATKATVDGLDAVLSMAKVGHDVEVAVTVLRGGDVVTPEPYLGARGHLVAIDADDLDYLHVHPHEGSTGSVRFTVADPAPGRYRLFFDFAVGGVVRTAAFTVDLPPTERAPEPVPVPTTEGETDGHTH